MQLHCLSAVAISFLSSTATAQELFPETGYNSIFPLETWIIIFIISAVILCLIVIIWIAFCVAIRTHNQVYRNYIRALRANRRSRTHRQHRVKEWLEDPATPEPTAPPPPRRHHLGPGEERARGSQTDGLRTGNTSSQQQLKLPSARAPPSAITFRRDHTEPRQLYVSVSLLQDLVAKQQISPAAAAAAAGGGGGGSSMTSAYPFGQHEPPSYNEIMRLDSPEFCDEREQMEMMNISAQVHDW